MLPLFFGVIYSRSGGLETGVRAVVLVLLVFVCVLGHEFTHGLMARRFGIEVSQITLYPIGGVASMSRIPREPGQEFLITIVGPLFNIALALLLFFPFYFWLGPDNLFSPSLSSWPQTFANVFWINPILGLFNLIPAFPMDGGRLLRSGLSRFMSHRKATRISVNFGYFFAILFALLGFYNKNWMLVLIAGFVYFSASKELKQ